MEEEIWKPIEGYDGMYEVSSLGRVRSWKNNHKERRIFPIMLCFFEDKNSRVYVSLYNQNTQKNEKIGVNRLVALSFLKNPMKYEQVDHIDGDVKNNSVFNLRWVSPHLNGLNCKTRKDNKTKIKGVSYVKRDKLWKARWQENKTQRSKLFKKFEDAVEHRRKMVERHYSQEHYIEDR